MGDDEQQKRDELLVCIRYSGHGNILINRRYGLDGLNFRASLTWNNLPQYIKYAGDTLFRFKSDIKTIIPINCGCKLCQVRYFFSHPYILRSAGTKDHIHGL